jgi:hypothetical protein
VKVDNVVWVAFDEVDVVGESSREVGVERVEDWWEEEEGGALLV